MSLVYRNLTVVPSCHQFLSLVQPFRTRRLPSGCESLSGRAGVDCSCLSADDSSWSDSFSSVTRNLTLLYELSYQQKLVWDRLNTYRSEIDRADEALERKAEKLTAEKLTIVSTGGMTLIASIKMLPGFTPSIPEAVILSLLALSVVLLLWLRRGSTVLAIRWFHFGATPTSSTMNSLRNQKRKLIRTLDRDLVAADIPKIDERGRRIVNHSTRNTLATMLNRAGVAPRVVQEAMRHLDIRLTMQRYTDSNLLDVSSALESLNVDSTGGPIWAPRNVKLGDKGAIQSQMVNWRPPPQRTKKPLFPRKNKRNQRFQVVGVIGFEPTTLCSQSRCASQAALHPERAEIYTIWRIAAMRFGQ